MSITLFFRRFSEGNECMANGSWGPLPLSERRGSYEIRVRAVYRLLRVLRGEKLVLGYCELYRRVVYQDGRTVRVEG